MSDTKVTQHTPGPWEAQDTAGHDIHGQTAIYDAGGKDVAIVYDGDANARLIAAAPDLLKALKGMVAHESRCDEKCPDLANARAAIKAAEGA